MVWNLTNATNTVNPDGSIWTTAASGFGWSFASTQAAPTAIPPAAVAISTGVSPQETQYSLFGHSIPISVFGIGRIGGEIIAGPWVSGGLATFCISFGFPADPTGTRDIREIAFDSEVVWDTGGASGVTTLAGGTFRVEAFTARFYQGTLTQSADAIETAHFGADAVAYRPQILLWFENLPLAGTKFGKIPYVSAVIGDGSGNDLNLGEAFERLAASPWVDMADFETIGVTDGVTDGGLILAQDYEFLGLIQQFGRFYPKWDLLQTDKLRIRDRGADLTPDISLDKSNLIGVPTVVRAEPNSVPSKLSLGTIDPDADYTIVESTAQRPRAPVAVTTSIKTESTFLPIIMDSSTRTAIVTYAKYHEETTRKKISFKVMAYGLEIEPGDLVGIDLGEDFSNEIYRIIETTHGADYTVECVGEAVLRCDLGAGTPGTPGTPPLDGLFPTSAFSMSRNLLTSYSGGFSSVVGGNTNWLDQSGNVRNLSGVTTQFPTAITAGPNSRAALNFDGSSQYASGSGPMTDLITVTDGYVIASFITLRTNSNQANFYDNDTVFADSQGNMGAHIKTGNTAGYAWDGNPDITPGIATSISVPHVVEWWHTGGIISFRFDGGAVQTVASSDTDLSGGVGDRFRIGRARIAAVAGYLQGQIFEVATFNTALSGTQRDAIMTSFKNWVGVP